MPKSRNSKSPRKFLLKKGQSSCPSGYIKGIIVQATNKKYGTRKPKFCIEFPMKKSKSKSRSRKASRKASRKQSRKQSRKSPRKQSRKSSSRKSSSRKHSSRKYQIKKSDKCPTGYFKFTQIMKDSKRYGTKLPYFCSPIHNTKDRSNRKGSRKHSRKHSSRK